MELSSTSSGPHSIRSINVRANVLSEWKADQVRIRLEAKKYFVATFLSLAVAGALVTASEMARGRLGVIERKHAAELTILNKAVSDASAAQKSSEPVVAASALHAQTASYFGRLTGELYAVLDAANSGMVFSTAKAEVRSAEIVIDVRADAESYDAAAAFAAQAGNTPSNVSSLASIRPSKVLGSEGVSFEYMKRVDLK